MILFDSYILLVCLLSWPIFSTATSGVFPCLSNQRKALIMTVSSVASLEKLTACSLRVFTSNFVQQDMLNFWTESVAIVLLLILVQIQTDDNNNAKINSYTIKKLNRKIKSKQIGEELCWWSGRLRLGTFVNWFLCQREFFLKESSILSGPSRVLGVTLFAFVAEE